MQNHTTCPRCHGPATMIDKAPPGESGDVVRCHREDTCFKLHNAARELERAHADIVDGARDFFRAMGGKRLKHPPAEVKIPGHIVAELLGVVADWKDAGQALHDATIAHAKA